MVNSKVKTFVCWLSGGVSSFVAAQIFWKHREQYGFVDGVDNIKYLYIDVADQLPDTMRFVKECEKYQVSNTEILKSSQGSVYNAVMEKDILKVPQSNYFPCTNSLKVKVRKEWEREYLSYHRGEELHYIWGFDFGSHEKDRAKRMDLGCSYAVHHYPLIEQRWKKSEIHGFFNANYDIERPMAYEKLGLKNSNCVFCLKGSLTSAAIFKDVMQNPIKYGFNEEDEVIRHIKKIYDERIEMERYFDRAIYRTSDGLPIFLEDIDVNYRGQCSRIEPEINIFNYFESGYVS